MKDQHGNIVSGEDEVMIVWKEHFQLQLNREFPREERALELLQPSGNVEDDADISVEEVKLAVARLRMRKAPGQYKITAEVIKKGGPAMLQMLHRIINRIWSEESTPTDWSKLLLIPTHKKGDRLMAENHRAITLNCIPGKVFCRIILNRIQEQI